MYSLAHYHVNALCFLSTCLCQTRGALFSLPGLERHSGQAPTWCCSALAQFTRSLAPQTLLLASSRFSPSVLASQQSARNQFMGMRWGKLHSETFSDWIGFRIPNFTCKKMPRIWVRLPPSVLNSTEDLFVGFKSSLKCSFPQDHQQVVHSSASLLTQVYMAADLMI